MAVCETVYLNGAFVPAGRAQVSAFDRGFLFAHAAYEVTAVYKGQLIDFDGHAARLSRTLAGIAIPEALEREALRAMHQQLLDVNGMEEGLIYLQVTAGDYAARDFAGPEVLMPTVFAYCDQKPLIGAGARDGIRAITLPDTRWTRRDMKTTQLLSQALAYRAARDAGAETALMIEDGLITEAASANFWIVDAAGQLRTRDLSRSILAGITREAVIAQLRGEGVEIVEAAFDLGAALGAREAFTTSAGAIIAPVLSIDSHTIGSGRPGPMTRRVQRLYYAAMGVDVAKIAPWSAL